MERFHQEMERLHLEMERFHQEMERLHLEMERFHQEMERLHLEMERFHQEMERLHLEMDDVLQQSASVPLLRRRLRAQNHSGFRSVDFRIFFRGKPRPPTPCATQRSRAVIVG